MNSKYCTFLRVFAILGALLSFGGGTAWAGGPWFVSTTGNDGNDCLSVGTACLTIQAAVTAASSGDTINVAAGTYDVSQIIINKGLTIQGAGASVTTIDGGDTVVAPSPGTLFIQDTDTSSPVMIDGFTFINPSNNTGIGEIVSIAASSNDAPITISNNHFIGESVDNVSSLFDNAIWIYWPELTGTINVTDNEFDHQWQPILVELPNPGVTITGNNFHDLFTSGVNPPQALSLWAYGGLDVTNPITINNNTFSAFDGWSIVLRGGGAPIVVGGTENAQFLNDVTIQNNNITADGAGIVLRNPAATLGDAALDGIVGATISGNTIASITSGTGTGIWLRGPNDNTDVSTGNTISGFSNGILSEQYNVAAVSSGVAVHRNSLTGNTTAVSNQGPSTIDAACNWWGSADGPGPVGPGSGDPVSTNVNFTPFLSSSNLAGGCAADSGTSTVSANPPSVVADGTTTSTITVTLLDSGGNPVSGKTVTLAADGGSSVISAASGLSDASGVVTFTVSDTVVEIVTYTATDTTDSVTVTQTAAVTFTTVPSADLSITKTVVTPGPYFVSQTVTYNIAVTNDGPDTATGVTVTDVLPSGTSFVSATPSQGSCSGTTTVTCNLGTLNNGITATITLMLQLDSGGNITNTASVSSDVSDPTPTNDSSSSTIAAASVPGIPMLSDWMLIALVSMLGAIAAMRMRN